MQDLKLKLIPIGNEFALSLSSILSTFSKTFFSAQIFVVWIKIVLFTMKNPLSSRSLLFSNLADRITFVLLSSMKFKGSHHFIYVDYQTISSLTLLFMMIFIQISSSIHFFILKCFLILFYSSRAPSSTSIA